MKTGADEKREKKMVSRQEARIDSTPYIKDTPFLRRFFNPVSKQTRVFSRLSVSSFLLICIVLFCGVLDAGAQQDTDIVLADLHANSKLHSPDDILADFVNGKPETAVIVLLQPTAAAKAIAAHSQALTQVPAEFTGPGAATYYNLKDKSVRKQLQATVTKTVSRVIDELGAPGVKVTQRFSYQFGFSAKVTPAALKRIVSSPDVIAVEKDAILQAHLAQGIPLMNATTARSTYTGAGISIAICDTGIDTSHPRLGGGGFPNAKVIGGYDTGDNDADPRPHSVNGEAHGTACAGIAAGDTGTMGDYIGGVAPDAKLYAVKISTGHTSSAETSAMIAGWEWCITHKNDDPANPIMIISTSFGGGRYTETCDSESSGMTTAAANAVAAGISIFASSGNDGYCDSMGWPACISYVNSVGAVYDGSLGTYGFCVSSVSCATKLEYKNCTSGYIVWDNTASDKVTVYSNSASFLTLFAPSHNAYTTDIVGSGGYDSGDYDTTFGGTSAACPYAAGSAALFQQAAKINTGSYLTPAELKTYLVSNGDNVTDSKVAITKPRINLGRAVDAVQMSPGTLQGTVTSSATSNPIVGAAVTLTGGLSTTTDSSGFYQFANILVGTYDVTASADGYPSQTAIDVAISSDATTTQDFSLTSCSTVVLLTENFDSALPPSLPVNWAQVDVSGTTGIWATATGTVNPFGGGTHSAPNIAYFNSWTALSGHSTRLYRTSGLDLSSDSNALVSLWMYHDTQYINNDVMVLQVSIDGGTNWTNLGTAVSRYDGTTGWKQHSFDISAYTGTGMTDVRIALLGISAYGNDLHLDDVSVTTCTPDDVTPPAPDPMTWSTPPYAVSSASIAMTATTATDTITPPVSYYFDFTVSSTGGLGGTDSGWQSSGSYTDAGLEPNHSYGYMVKARDSVSTPNETANSSINSIYTHANAPGSASFSGITQTAIRANWTANSNRSGTEYYSENITNSTNSGWTTNTYWDSTGLSCETSYAFRVKARNGDGIETGWTDLGTQDTLVSSNITTVVSAGDGNILCVPLVDICAEITVCTITPAIGYLIGEVTGCGGTLSEDTYTTGQITADCTVTASFPSGTLYEDAEDGNIAGWSVYDNDPPGALISNVYDGGRQSQVIDLLGSGKSNGYQLKNTDGSYWQNPNQFIVQWSMKYSEDFIVYILVDTSAGLRYMKYTPTSSDGLGAGTYIHHGLGSDVIDGQWHTFTRDLQADLLEAQPGVTINQVNGFFVRGSGRFDDIKLLNEMPTS